LVTIATASVVRHQHFARQVSDIVSCRRDDRPDHPRSDADGIRAASLTSDEEV
jgi:hypothetical protein